MKLRYFKRNKNDMYEDRIVWGYVDSRSGYRHYQHHSAENVRRCRAQSSPSNRNGGHTFFQ